MYSLRSIRGVITRVLSNRIACAYTAYPPFTRSFSELSNVIEAESGKTKLQGYFERGFIVNNVQVEGAVLCCSDLWALWRVKGVAGITPDSLAIVDLVDPKPEIVVIGCGSTMGPLSNAVQDFLNARGIAYEAQDTRNALSLFNFLNDEGRVVVGALLPPGEPSAQGGPSEVGPASGAGAGTGS